MSVHFSSRTVEWETPEELFEELNREFRFTLDVCATAANAKCKRFFTEDDDGLSRSWTGACWMNPPYGRAIKQWMAKAFESAQSGATVVCLVPARTDTAWWHDYVTKADEVLFVRGRLHFGGSPTPAPFPSAIVIFRPRRQLSKRFSRGVFFRTMKRRRPMQAAQVASVSSPLTIDNQRELF